MSILNIPQTIPLLRSNYILSKIVFFYVPAMGQYTRGEGEGKKTQVKGRTENERHKSSENAQEK